MTKIQQDVAADIKQHITATRFTEDSEDAVTVIIQVLDYAKANADLFKVLLNEYGNSTFKNELMYLAHEKVIEELRESKQLSQSVTKYVEEYVINGILRIIYRWLNDGCLETSEQLAELMMKLMMQGIESLY